MKQIMKSKGKLYSLFFLFITVLFLISCKTVIDDNIPGIEREPLIEPDYVDVTIPPNIAPLNFVIKEDAGSYRISAISEKSGYRINIMSSDGIVRFPEKSWKKLTAESRGDSIRIQVYSMVNGKKNMERYNPFYMSVSDDPIDPYLAYRLIHPGYYSWSNIRIMQRSLESFREESLIENQIMEKNCANCHSFNRNSADRFMVHIRGSLGGTYFVEDGRITRTDPKIDAMPGSATYPSWHPDGRYVAFSSNQVRQSFYSIPEKSIEVFDLVSSLILYDRTNNEIISVTDKDTTKYLLTFPSWSPDGKYLYFCRARKNISDSDPEMMQIFNTHYDIARKSFDSESRSFGDTEIVFNAADIKKSASFPRISPDGKYLVFTLHDYGTFPIWHQESDLYLLDMRTGVTDKMELNSDMTESYHTWSLNGRWLVFSSKRLDGRSTRPFFAHIDSLGKEGKPFVLPQKDPSLYDRMLESFNIPEFVNGRIKLNARDFARASRQVPVKARSGNPEGTPPVKAEVLKDANLKENERAIHE